MNVPLTTNSADVFAILNARRGTPAAQIKPKQKTVTPYVDAWTLSTWIAGLKRGKVWAGRLLRTLVLDRPAYQEVARDAYMTGPAMLIGLIGLTLNAIEIAGSLNVATLITNVITWPIAVLVLYWTARLLNGKASYTATFRVTGFAYFGYWLTALSIVPVVGPLLRLIGLVLEFLGVWLGTAQAHNLRGWRTLLLPVVYVLVVFVIMIIVVVLLGGTAITIESIRQDLGW